MKAIHLLLLLVSAFIALPLRAAPGDLDPLDTLIVGTHVSALATQPDGKIIIGGSFSSVLGQPRANIARLNADGTLDAGFDPKANSVVRSVAIQPDGKILIAGQFTSLQPNGAAAATARSRIARLNENGTLDATFDPKANATLFTVMLQPDGRILICGDFTSLQPNGAASATPRNRIARLEANGNLVTSFNPNPNGSVRGLALQPDGKLLLCGAFTTLQPNGAASATTRNFAARVNDDGTLDTGFHPNISGASAEAMTVQPDGKILIGGNFTTAGGTARQHLARVDANGVLDSTFNPKPSGRVYGLALQTDGRILAAGQFTTFQPNGAPATTPRNRVARLNADGTLDPAIDPNANGDAFAISLQADGKILLGGEFATLQPNNAGAATPRSLFARLQNGQTAQSLAATSPTRVLWSRSGPAPEFSRVTFELSMDSGLTWTLLGNGSRVGTTADWEITGLSLSGDGRLRARGWVAGGLYCGSSGMFETISAYSTTGGEFTWTSSAGSVTITSYTGSSTGQVVIPATIAWMPVTTLGNGCFADAEFSSVIIPGSITSIENYAFSGCTSLTSVTIPASVTSIGSSAFNSCTGLTSVVIPASVTSIGTQAFIFCTGLTSATITSGSIGSYAFSHCWQLTSVTIQSNVPSIGSAAFYGCGGLTSVTIESGVNSIGPGAFSNCSGLPSVTMPSSVTNIGAETFYGCTGLTSVTIPSSVVSLEEGTFYGCTGLASVAIPSSVTSIGVQAFYGCRGLTNVTIPSSVVSIGGAAFADCTGLVGVTIPSRVTNIGSQAFRGCSSLIGIQVVAGNSSYSSSDGVLFNKAETDILMYPGGKPGSYLIPSSVTTIDHSAFRGCTGLTSVSISSNVANIGVAAFYGCTGLTSVTIPSSVTHIDYGAFLNCSNLTSATFTGNAPSSLGSSEFDSTAPGFTIFFYTGATGFTTPTWNGYAAVEIANPTAPEIVVEIPADTDFNDGSTLDFAAVDEGSTKTFTVFVRNTGTGPLNGLSLSKSGTDAPRFSNTALPVTTLMPGGTSSFSITFTPPATAGVKTAVISIASNDADENPFEIHLSGSLGAPLPPPMPTLVTSNAAVYEDGQVTLNTSATSNAPVGIVTTLRITGIPPLWSVISNGGTYNPGAGIWTYELPAGTTTYFGGPTIGPPANSDEDLPILAVTLSNSNTANGLSSTATGIFSVTVDAVADAPNLGASASQTFDGVGYPMTISTSPIDVDGSESIAKIVIKDIPSGGSLSAGFVVSPSVYQLSLAQLANLKFLPPPGATGSVVLRVESHAAETNKTGLDFDTGNDVAITSIDVPIQYTSQAEIEVEVDGTNLDDGEASIDFGSGFLGQPVARTFIVRNDGTVPLTGVLVSEPNGDFTVVQPSSSTIAAGTSTNFDVIFTPSAIGIRSASLQIASNDADENPFEVNLTGTGQATVSPVFNAPGDVTFTSSGFNAGGLDLGFITLGFAPSPGTQLMIVNNTGTNPITGTLAGLPDGGLALASFNGVSYAFIADYSGGDGNDLVLTLASPDIAVELLPGTVIGDGGTLDFGTISTGVAGPWKQLIFRNVGTGPLGDLAYALAGPDAGHFEYAPFLASPPTTLQPGEAVSLMIRFTPPSIDPISATLSVSSNDPDENPFEIVLSGRGDSLSPTFSSPSEVARSTPSFDASGIRFGRLQLAFQPAAGASLTVVEQTGTGPISGELTGMPDGGYVSATYQGVNHVFQIDYSGGDGNDLVLNLASPDEFVVVDFDEFSFPDGAVHGLGSPLESGGFQFSTNPLRGFYVYGDVLPANPGSGAIYSSAPVVATRAGQAFDLVSVDFAERGFAPFTIVLTGTKEGGGSVTTSVTLNGGTVSTESLSGFGVFTSLASLELSQASYQWDRAVFRVPETPQPELIVEDASGAPLAAGSTLDFGSHLLGQRSTRTFTVRNEGTAPLTGLVVSGATGDFTFVQPGSSTLAPGSSTTFDVMFTPTANGVRSGSLQIVSNDADESPFDVNLMGTGQAAVSPVFNAPGDVIYTSSGFNAGGLDLGALTLGFAPAPGTQLMIVNNTGAAAVTGTFIGLPEGAILTADFWDVVYYFQLSYVGGSGNDIVLTLVEPAIVVEQPAGEPLVEGLGNVNFGVVDLCRSEQRSFVVRNPGPIALTGLAMTLGSTDAAHFSVVTPPPLSLAPGESAVFILRFTPLDQDGRVAEVEFHSDQTGGYIFDFLLGGTGSGVVSPIFNAPTDVGVTVGSFSATGFTWGSLTLGFTPTSGTILKVVNNTGAGPISGVLAGLAEGGQITATFGGQSYTFQASYTAGDGNDLVLALVSFTDVVIDFGPVLLPPVIGVQTTYVEKGVTFSTDSPAGLRIMGNSYSQSPSLVVNGEHTLEITAGGGLFSLLGFEIDSPDTVGQFTLIVTDANGVEHVANSLPPSLVDEFQLDNAFAGNPRYRNIVSARITNEFGFGVLLDNVHVQLSGIATALPLIDSRLLTNGDLEITFTGILQSSPNLLPTSWQDVTPQPTSPYLMPKASLGNKGFFRARGR